MDSPSGSAEWPSDLADQVAELNCETGQSTQEPQQFTDASVLHGLSLPTATLTEAQIQMLTHAGYNFSFFQLPSTSAGQTSDSSTEQTNLQHDSIHSLTDTLQLHGITKDIPDWAASGIKNEGATGTPSTVILNIDGTSQEIPISFHLDSSTSIGHAESPVFETKADDDDLPKGFESLQRVTNGNIHMKEHENKECDILQRIHVLPAQVSTSPMKGESTINQPKEQENGVYSGAAPMVNNIPFPIIKISPSTDSDKQAESKDNEKDVEEMATPSPEKKQNTISENVNGNATLAETLVRKSSRLARQIDQILQKAKPKYNPESKYDTSQMWCDDCQCAYEEHCPHHTSQIVFDKIVLSRAWSSLPPLLTIYRLGPTTDMGVFSKKFIQKRMQFGPFISDLSDDKSVFENSYFPLLVEQKESTKYIEAVDENKCNWMMFIRPAKSYSEQNLVAYQYEDGIYFSSVKDIHPKEELKVWYAAHYANRIGVKVYPKDKPTENEGKFECTECNKKLKSAALLQKHITDEHEEDPLPDNLTPLNEITEIGQANETKQTGQAFQSWKKTKRNMYLNKIKKYKELKTKAEIKRRESKECWKCAHCTLTFDNATLLNIHTLTHAAEAALLMEQQHHNQNDALAQLSAAAVQIHTEAEQRRTLSASGINEVDDIKCPCCSVVFKNTTDLIHHTAVHARTRRPRQNRRSREFNPAKPFPCNRCIKTFSTDERLQRHRLVHSTDDSHKPLTCEICQKKFMNNPALACHMKTHSDEKYYTCPICREGFDQMYLLRGHGKIHAVNGVYPCPHCHKTLYDFNTLRKHMRLYHPYKELPCPFCEKVFPRTDKLKLHMLKHSNIKEYMCDQCGRQFKRKDKLKEHSKRMHDPSNPKTIRQYNPGEAPRAKFVPKVQPTDYQRFIYKCHDCMLGFKRRGMLVNHLARRHPDIKAESVPELNLPILRTQRDFFCQYCDKVYKSSSKRKAHIMKNHPGAELPPSCRVRGPEYEGIVNNYGINAATYSQLIGSVAATPHGCQFCHKQYASKPKLLQHMRKDHPGRAQAKKLNSRPGTAGEARFMIPVTSDKEIDIPIDATFVVQHQEGQTADLLTQAMSELTHSFQAEYRNSPQSQLQAQQYTPAEYQLNLSNTPEGRTNLMVPPALLQTAMGTASIDITQFLQEVNSEEDVNGSVDVGGTQMQQITIVHGNQSQTISVPVSLATQLITRSFEQNTVPTK